MTTRDDCLFGQCCSFWGFRNRRRKSESERARGGRPGSPCLVLSLGHIGLERNLSAESLHTTPRDGLDFPRNDAQTPHKRTITATTACRKCGEPSQATPRYRPAVNGTLPARTKWTWQNATSLVGSEPALLKSSCLQLFTFVVTKRILSHSPLPPFWRIMPIEKKDFPLRQRPGTAGRQPPLRRGEDAEKRKCDRAGPGD